jgi:hypothetical protein
MLHERITVSREKRRQFLTSGNFCPTIIAAGICRECDSQYRVLIRNAGTRPAGIVYVDG